MATIQITTGIIHLDSGQTVPFRTAGTQVEVSVPDALEDGDEAELMTAVAQCGFSSIVWRKARSLPRRSVATMFDFARAKNPDLPTRQPAMDPAVDRDLLEHRSVEQKADPGSPDRRSPRKGYALGKYARTRRVRMKARAKPDMKTPFELDENTRYLVFPDGSMTPLTNQEYAVLFTLLKKKGKAVSREALRIAMYGLDGPDSQDSILTVIILRIRAKLGHRAAIMTLWGVGYTLLYPGDKGYSSGVSSENIAEFCEAAE